MIARPPQPGLKFSRSAALTAIQPQYQRPGCRHQQAVSILVAERLRTQSGKSSSQGPSREVREDVKETARHEGRQQKADSHGSRQSIENWRDLLDVRNWTARGRGLALLNALVVLCATNWVVLKSSEDAFDPFTFALLRFSVAAAAFWPFLKEANKEVWKGGLELGFWAGLAYLFQAEGIMTTEASRASFLSAFTVIVVPLLSGLSGKGVTRVTWLSALVALGGMALLEQGGAPAGIGDAWNLLSALFFGVQVFRTEHHSRNLGQQAALPLLGVVMLTIMSMSAAATTIAHPQQVRSMVQHPALLKGAILGHLGLKHLLPILWTGLFSTDAVLLIEVVALRDVPSTDAAILYTMEPVAGAALAWGFLGERWSASGWVGAALIVGSSLAAQFFSKPSDGSENRA